MQLIYRAARYNYTPAPVNPVKADHTIRHRLQYRGCEFVYHQPVDRQQVMPKAVNWRFAQVCASGVPGTCLNQVSMN